MFTAFMFVLGIAIGLAIGYGFMACCYLFDKSKIVYADNVVTGCPHVNDSEDEE